MNAVDMAGDWKRVELPPGYGLELAGRLAERNFSQRVDGWRPEEIERLKSLFYDDVAIPDIVKALGRRIHGVRTKICELGLRRQSARPWSEEEDGTLLKLYGREPTLQISLFLGRTPGSVYSRAKKLDLTSDAMPPWDEVEIGILRSGFSSGTQMALIGDRLGRTLSAVASKAHDLGLRHANAVTRWSDDEYAIVARGVDDNQTARQIAQRLCDAGYSRTRNGVKQVTNQLGYDRSNSVPWSPEEDAELRAGFAAAARVADIVPLGRTKSGARWRARHLGLQHPKPDGARGGPAYSDDELAFLKANYGKMPGKELALALGRELRAIYNQAFHMGLKSGRNVRFSAEEDLRLLETLDPNGPDLADVAKLINRDYETAWRRRSRLRNPSAPARPKGRPPICRPSDIQSAP